MLKVDITNESPFLEYAELNFDNLVCCQCKNKAIKFYLIEECAGYYDEYRRWVVAMLCDDHWDTFIGAERPLPKNVWGYSRTKPIVLDELIVMATMEE